MIGLPILLIAVFTALACAIPGVFLVLRRMSMMSDAISHSVLPGIIIAFLIIQDRHSPLLIIGAALAGVIMVILTELIYKSKLVKEDSAIGLVFPALFSFGVLLISFNLDNVHFHESTVLLGDIALASLDTLVLFGVDFGPKSVYLMAVLFLLNIGLFILFFKEMKLSTFDTQLSKSFGFSPSIIHYAFMALVSVTAVGAFETAGSILVIALMITPAASAYLLTNKLVPMMIIAGLLAIASAIIGFFLSLWTNTSPAGSISVVTGLLFLLTYLFAPKTGVLYLVRKRSSQKREFSKKIVLLHLANHEGKPEELIENRKDELHRHILWNKVFLNRISAQLIQDGLVYQHDKILKLTEEGKQFIKLEYKMTK